jgi:Ca2+-binding RTX toxin-like protein
VLTRFRPIRLLVPALAAAATLVAIAAPGASAESRLTVWLNQQTGVLSITGTEVNDYATVSQQGSTLVVNVKNWPAADFSGNCTEGGGLGDWVVTCPALNVNQITFDGKLQNDSFKNFTSIASEPHGGPGIDFFTGGSGPDRLYGDGDHDSLDGGAGPDTLDGGAGVDTITGGDGSDVASWSDATGPVTASLDGAANDGVAGENENIPADVEGIVGSPYADKLSGSGTSNDALFGGDGPDDLEGWGGDDQLYGQAGNDTLHPNAGADVLSGGADSDTLSYAGVGQSVYVYQDGSANDGMLGEHDNVTSIENLTGSAYGDDLEGTAGDDVINGGAGADKITAKFGDDTVYGGDGPDNIDGGPGAPDQCGDTGCTKFDTDTIYGGADSDTVDYSSRSDRLVIALDGSSRSGGFMENDVLSSIENGNGGSGDDTLYGNAAPNSLSGGAGNDGISAGKGNDYVSGGPGNDFLDGGEGGDFVTGGEDNDTLIGVGGTDWLYGGSGTDLVSYYGAPTGVTAHIGSGKSGPAGEADRIDGDVENLEGSSHPDKLYGDGGPNLLIGDGRGDLLVGAGGADTLQGGAGPDTLLTNGDGVKDTASCGTEADAATVDKVDAVAADCETVKKP